jgi:hypothetical protein
VLCVLRQLSQLQRHVDSWLQDHLPLTAGARCLGAEVLGVLCVLCVLRQLSQLQRHVDSWLQDHLQLAAGARCLGAELLQQP